MRPPHVTHHTTPHHTGTARLGGIHGIGTHLLLPLQVVHMYGDPSSSWLAADDPAARVRYEHGGDHASPAPACSIEAALKPPTLSAPFALFPFSFHRSTLGPCSCACAWQPWPAACLCTRRPALKHWPENADPGSWPSSACAPRLQPLPAPPPGRYLVIGADGELARSGQRLAGRDLVAFESYGLGIKVNKWVGGVGVWGFRWGS